MKTKKTEKGNQTMSNLYLTLKKAHSDALNAFPLGFAFSNRQFDDMMKKWGLDPNADTDKIFSLGAGCFVRKSDADAFSALTDRLEKERAEAFAADKDGATGYVFDALLYELENHEYCITGEVDPALSACGLTAEEIGANPVWVDALKRACIEAQH